MFKYASISLMVAVLGLMAAAARAEDTGKAPGLRPSPGKPGAPVALYAEPSSAAAVLTIQARAPLTGLSIEVRGLDGVEDVRVVEPTGVTAMAAGEVAIWNVTYSAPLGGSLAVFATAEQGDRITTRAFSVTIPAPAGALAPQIMPQPVTRNSDGRRLHLLPGRTQTH